MTSQPRPIRVRFAPSPTGHLHLGGARTALFNWLFARRHGGAFVLRIEDTDRERSTPESAAAIVDSLRWLGTDWDEGPEKGGDFGPYFQSDRRELYLREAERLLEMEAAYRCYCTPEELEERRKRARAEKASTAYDGRCGRLSDSERRQKEAQGLPSALRLKVPPGTTSWDDLLRGEISFENGELEDFVIFKGDGFPTYHFAVVVDDALMEISHVIRGDDHLSNTPRHLLIFEALGYPPPAFAHVPMILGPDGGRLSKRHGASSIGEFREQGYLAEAVVNGLALLGWATADSRQTFTREELIAEFDLDRVSGSAVAFDPDKLRWLNNHHYMTLPVPERLGLLAPFWEKAGIDVTGLDREWLEEIVELVGDRIKVLPDVVPYTEFFFRPVTPGKDEEKILRKAEPLIPVLRELTDTLAALEPYDRASVEDRIRRAAEAAGVGAGKLIQPLRAAVAGRKVSPGLFESFELLGKETVITRLRAAWPEEGPTT